jgi:hypothetical protein
MCIKRTEADYKHAVTDAEVEFGPDSILTGDALVDLARFYERSGLLDAANDCDERIRGILERYLLKRGGAS